MNRAWPGLSIIISAIDNADHLTAVDTWVRGTKRIGSS